MARKKHKLYPMTPNLAKIREAILFIVNEARVKRKNVTQYDIAKAIFIADKSHLNKYGRPVTFDNYCAMLHGPVPSFVYDVLKEDRAALAKIGGALWSRSHAPHLGEKCFLFEEPQRAVDMEILTESDIEELSDGLTVVKSLGFGQIRKLTHEDPAYVDAWEENSDRKQFSMSYALLFDEVNDEMAEQISFASKHL